MDTPTQSQAAARESAAEVLQILRQLAGLVWPDHASAAVFSSCSNGIDPASYADWGGAAVRAAGAALTLALRESTCCIILGLQLG